MDGINSPGKTGPNIINHQIRQTLKSEAELKVCLTVFDLCFSTIKVAPNKNEHEESATTLLLFSALSNELRIL